MNDKPDQDKPAETTPPEPVPEPPAQKLVEVNCGNCGAHFQFPVDNNVTSFGFDCTNCSSHNEVDLAQ